MHGLVASGETGKDPAEEKVEVEGAASKKSKSTVIPAASST